MADLYAILDLNPSASAKAIKAAYRKKAKLYHPDKNNGNKLAEERFREVQEAYQILSNLYKRQQYDVMNLKSYSAIYNANQFSGKGYPFSHGMSQPRDFVKKKKTTEIVPQESDSEEYRYLLISIIVAVLLLLFVGFYRF